MIKQIKAHLNKSIQSIIGQKVEFVKQDEQAFTRKRRLSLETMIRTILGMGGKSLSKELLDARLTVSNSAFVQISDPEILIPIIHQVFADNEAAVADFKSGKRNADKAFTGFLMKATKGQANPQVALKLLAQELAKLKEN
ncbi:putative transposase [Streptococcus pneumoniae]|nr:putative transposase [Streptococcus pneumoniae]